VVPKGGRALATAVKANTSPIAKTGEKDRRNIESMKLLQRMKEKQKEKQDEISSLVNLRNGGCHVAAYLRDAEMSASEMRTYELKIRS
jgi:hypothetical protein